ncbi:MULTISPECIES: hypothetical protein [Olivibacter]|uniref:Uncharacterized protein n=2 Tax=Sphingobacteriaceae TaxID=84566 RepID=F4C6F0_SPHS2|nr:MULTISPECIES: hypothetical protein [Olivibacter]
MSWEIPFSSVFHSYDIPVTSVLYTFYRKAMKYGWIAEVYRMIGGYDVD